MNKLGHITSLITIFLACFAGINYFATAAEFNQHVSDTNKHRLIEKIEDYEHDKELIELKPNHDEYDQKVIKHLELKIKKHQRRLDNL